MQKRKNVPVVRRELSAGGGLVNRIVGQAKLPPVTVNLSKDTSKTLYQTVGILGGLYVVGRIAGVLNW